MKTQTDCNDVGAQGGSAPLGQLRRSTALSRFARDEEGGLLAWSLFTIIGIFAATGLGLSVQFYEVHRAHLQNTLDRAVLAATDLDQTLDPEDVIADYVKRAGLEGALTDASVENGINYRTSSAAAKVSMRTMFTVGQDRWDVEADSTAIESITDVEISLVLDNSGSMGWNDDYRLNLLKPAAKSFIETVTRPVDGIDNGSVAVSIVPFSTQVNAGPLLAGELNFSNHHNYSHCARFGTNDYNSTSIDPNTQLQRAGHFDIFTWDWPVDHEGVVCPFDESRHITPWSRDAEALKAQIDAMWAGGNTSMDVATKWGAALLDPEFQDVFDSLAEDEDSGVEEVVGSQPFDYERENTLKVLVVMSDGQNTDEYRLKSSYRSGNSPVFLHTVTSGSGATEKRFSYYTNRSGTSADYYSVREDRWRSSPDGGNAADRLTWPELFNEMSVARYSRDIRGKALDTGWQSNYNNTYTRVRANDKNTRTSAICTAARDAGIVVYTIGMDTYGQGDATLEDCAGNSVNFFDVSAIEIDQAFAAIAQQINQLRLTQ
ncbi:MAG: Tad domain-containing protein [Pseudomonadota bacterium]